MWNKIYFLVLAIAVLVMVVLTFFAFTWLQSVTKPVDVAANYDYYSNLYGTFLWLSSLVLLILANVLLWKTRRAWALWTTFLYFAAFVLLQSWWLGGLYLDFKQRNNLAQETFSFSGLIGSVLCVLAAVGIFFDQFLVLRMRDRIFGAAAAAAAPPPTADAAQPAEESLPEDKPTNEEI
jgi:hypothetical protein